MPGSPRVVANLMLWYATTHRACYGAMGQYSTESQAYAQDHRRWIDRTGNARAGLSGNVASTGGSMILATVAHTVSYGIHLELRPDYMGRYKILEEAILHDISGLLNKIRAIMGGRGFYIQFGSSQAPEGVLGTTVGGTEVYH